MAVRRRMFPAAAFGLAAVLSGRTTPPYRVREHDPGVILFTELDSATVTLDLSQGLDVVPGSAALVLRSGGGERIVQKRRFPLGEVDVRALPDGRSRHVFALGEAQSEELLRFWMDATRLAPRGSPTVTTGITPAFGICRTGPHPDSRPAVVTGKVVIERLPDFPPTRIDLRENARAAGGSVERHVEPCPA